MERVALPGGVTLAYDVFDFTNPWRKPEPLVFVHGFSKNRRFWYEWIPQFARDYRVYNVDQRGHGDSSPAAPDFQFSLSPFARDLVEFLDTQNIEAAHFVMAEFASAVAIELAADYPARVKSLVLPGFGYNWRAGAASPKAWSEMLRKEGTEAWARETNKYRLPADADAGLREWYIAQQSRMPASLLIKMFDRATTLDQTERLPLVTAPTLILCGTLAQQATADSMALAQQLMPRATLVMLEGMPFNVMTACPQTCISVAADFLKDLDSPKDLETKNPTS